MAKPFWATQFRIQDSVWDEITRESAQKMKSPLWLAFEKGLINENHFIAWERERSGLLSLKSIFFNGQPPRDLWMHFDFKVCEQVFCLPVGQYEDHIYWAKLSDEPNGMESQLKDVIWVLAPFSSLKKWFAIWQSEVSIVPPIHNSISGSFGGFSNIQNAEPQQSTDTEESDSGHTNAKIEEIAEEYSGPPQGIGALAGEKTLANIDFGAILPVKENTPEPVDLPPIFSQDTNPSFSVTGTQVDFVLPPIKDSFSDLPPIPLKPKPSLANQTSPSELHGNAPNLNLSDSIGPIALEALSDRLKSAQSQEELAKVILGGWQNYFDRVMILLVQGDSLLVWRWWGAWSSQFSRGALLSLNSPSIFKITYNTLHPYHGQASPGIINDQFFTLTCSGIYPEHVNVFPVIAENQCVAMLVGCCTTTESKKITLNRLEDQAGLFAQGLLQFMAVTPKAG